MKITIKSITLTNFKGIKSMTVNFDGERTTIKGRNESGKSTIYDAFTWLLFGKDAADRKDFEIKTLDKSGRVIPRIDHEVVGVLVIDGLETTLKRVYREKWVKARGSAEAEFSGHETLFFVNDVPKSQKEYQDYIASIIPEETFKLVTNPAYFNSIKWQDRRRMLTSVAGIPTDTEIAGTEFAHVLELMARERKTAEELKKQYAANKTKLKAEMEQIPGRLDEVERATPEAEDWTAIEKQITELTGEVTKLDESIRDSSKGVQEQIDIRTKTLRIKSEIEQAISNREFIARKTFAELAAKKDNTLAGIKQNIEFKQNQSNDYKVHIEQAENEFRYNEKMLQELRDDYKRVSSKVATIDVNTTCPTCGQGLPDADVEKTIAEVREKFNQYKSKELDQMNEKGKKMVATSESLKNRIEGYKQSIAQIDAEILALKQQYLDTEKSPSELKSVEAILSDDKEYLSLKQQLADVYVPEAVEMPDVSELQSAKAEISSRIDTLKSLLSKRAIIEQNTARKNELLRQETEIGQQIADLENMEFAIQGFTKKKMSEVENAVNKLFHFNVVSFRMFEPQINGGEAETCVCLVKGVPFTDANTAGKINAGLEIISVFSELNDLTAPVFVDNAEANLNVVSIPSQTVLMYVSDCDLTVLN